MRTLFDLQPVNDSFGDPGLYVDFRDERRAIMFDLGDLTALAPRKLMRLSHVFVTHTHMDHFAGFDHLLRVVLGRKPGIVVFGGPGFTRQVEHKLAAYTWNVVHRYDMELVIDAREVRTDGSAERACFSSLRRFVREDCGRFAPSADVVHEEPTFRVRARFVDHDIPCLAYAIEEKAQIKVDKDRLLALGLGAGAWLHELKRAVLLGAAGATPIRMQWRDRTGVHDETRTVDELQQLILDIVPGRRIGYVTDLRYTDSNVDTLAQLLAGVDVLYIESVFLDEDVDHATRKNHLTARQAGTIARRVGAKAVVPFHFSPRYEGRAAQLVSEVRAAWSDSPAPP
jgi:ribonuclease Z